MTNDELFLIPDDENGDDEEIEEEEEESTDSSPVAADAAPFATNEDVAVCPECAELGRKTEYRGPFKGRALSTHRRFKHADSFYEQKAERDEEKASEEPKPRGRPRRDSAPRGNTPAALREVRDNVELFYTMGGTVLSMRDPVCGQAFQASAKNAATAWVELAKKNEKVRAFWSGGQAATGWLQLAMAHLPIAMAVQQHHIYPRLEARQARREAAMMENYYESAEDLAGEPVVYTTTIDDLPDDAFIPEGAGPGYATSDVGYDVGENGFTEGALG